MNAVDDIKCISANVHPAAFNTRSENSRLTILSTVLKSGYTVNQTWEK